MKIKHIYQPDGISCGPTCLKMIYNHINHGDVTIEDLKVIVGTDNIKGTTLEDMIVGLNHFNIDFESPLLMNEYDAISYLNDALTNNYTVILRTLTRGIKHWVIADEFDGLYYDIKDPWLGELKYDEQELIDIWKPRDFHCIKIINSDNKNENLNQINEIRGWIEKVKNFKKGEPVIRRFKPSDKAQVMDLVVKAFSHLMPEEHIPTYIDQSSNFNKSIVVDRNNEIIGVYLLGDRQLPDVLSKNDKVYVDLDEYSRKNGVEGVALVVKDSEKGTGLGSKLKDYTKNLGVDYIWGMQYKDLGNLDHWLRRRILAAENQYLNFTVEDLK
jgi:predicted double-glycine peptidase